MILSNLTHEFTVYDHFCNQWMPEWHRDFPRRSALFKRIINDLDATGIHPQLAFDCYISPIENISARWFRVETGDTMSIMIRGHQLAGEPDSYRYFFSSGGRPRSGGVRTAGEPAAVIVEDTIRHPPDLLLFLTTGGFDFFPTEDW